MSSALVKKILAQRESRFEVMPERFLTIRRPAEMEMVGWRKGITVDRLKEAVVGWEGFLESDFLGSAIGASSAVDFDVDVFAAWIVDRGAEFSKVSVEVQRLVVEHIERKEAAAKN
jgi:hypothetical protein